ncbi:MAG: 50S ribosomal protein L10 [Dehalococcoidales bacterium]|nr:50S ribosomal protein L10 [Dehalococcoidales bacterium]
MPTEKKKQIVSRLSEVFTRAQAGVFTDYRGLPTSELNELRRKLKESGVEYRVVKNSLALIAARQAGKEALARAFVGPLAVAFDFSDSPVAARMLLDYIRETKSSLGIKGGFFGNRLLSPKEVENLATLPPRNELIAKMLGGIQGPLYGLAGVLAGPIRGIMGVLQARIKQLEGA